MKENKDALVMVNPAIQFCEYYPGSIGNSNPDSIGVDLSKGTLFYVIWEEQTHHYVYCCNNEG